jgi:hypothetical protein
MRKRGLKIGRARRSSAPGQRKTALYSIGDELWGSGIRSDFPITVQGTFGPKTLSGTVGYVCLPGMAFS